jgi:outer membrane receptor protein involved in Fe transport
MSSTGFTFASRGEPSVKRGSRARLARIASLLALALVGFALSGAPPSWAGSTQTGTLRGRIVDSKGEALPGVVVLLRSVSLIRERALSTDVDGNYFAAGLPPGNYTVTAQMSGFLSLQVDAVVEIDQVTLLKPITLREGQIQETVAVVADQPIVDKTRTEGSVEISKDFTEKLPAARSYNSLLEFSPGVVDTGGQGNPNILGGTSNSNVYLVDGVSGRDPVTGTFGFNLNYDAIETVDVKLSGISAEYGQFQGGLTNLATKSGGNEFTGSVRDVVSAPSWTALYTGKSQNQFAEEIPGVYSRPKVPGRSPGDDNTTNRIGTTLGGPIVPDNAWFFLAWDSDRARASNPLGNPTGGPNGDGNFINVFEGESALGKVTWQANQNNRLQYQYSRDPADTSRCYGEIFFGGPCYDDFTVDLQGQGGFVWIANWNAVWGSSVVSDLKVARFKNHFDIRPLSPIPVQPGLPLSGTGEVSPAIETSTGSTFDANIFSSDPETRLRSQYEGSATMFFDTSAIGSHTLKVGADYQTQEQTGASTLQGNGLFFFAFANPVPPQGGGNPYDINNRSYLLWYDFSPVVDSGPVNKYYVLYAQDDWQLNDHLSFNLGLRYEKSVNENDVGEKIIDDTGFAPRLGVSWDLTGEGRDVVKATAARYLAGINLTTLSPFARNAGGQSSYDVYYNLDYGTPGTPNWALIAQVRPDPDTSTFAKGIKPQNIDELTLAYERRLTPTFAVGARGVYRKWDNIITTSYTYDYSNVVPRQITLIDNNPDAKRSYKGVILSAEKRLAHNWQLAGSYVYSKAEGNVTNEESFDLFGSYPGVPQTTRNRFGLLPWDTKHSFKTQAFYAVPLRGDRHGLSIGGVFEYTSGTPYARSNTASSVVVGPGADGIQDQPLGSPGASAPNDQTDTVLEFFEPRGSHRTPAFATVDLSLNYSYRLVKDLVFQARFEVFNATNQQAFDTAFATWDPTIGSDQGNNHLFGHPTAYSQFQTPRTFDVQFALIW